MHPERFKYDGPVRELTNAARATLDALDINTERVTSADPSNRTALLNELGAVQTAASAARGVYTRLAERESELRGALTAATPTP